MRVDSESVSRGRPRSDVSPYLDDTIDSITWDPTAVLRSARRSWTLLAAGVAIGGALAMLISLASERTFTSSAAVLPQGRTGGGGGLSALASQLGIGQLGSESGQGATFYVELLGSRYTIREVVVSPVEIGGRRTVSLVDALGITGKTAALRRERAVDYLARRLALSSSPKTGVVRLSVSLPDSALVRPVVGRFIDLADRFNMERRQTQARAERVFVERRLEEAGGRLREAEGRLQSFLQENRDYRAPALQVEHGRLEREVMRAQQTLSTLQSAFEQARIEEVRNTPVISVLEPPDEPIRPDPRHTLAKIFVGALLGLGVTLVFAHLRYRDTRDVG